MTENQNTPTSELDFDEWLAGGERTTHHVTLFGRLGLIGDIERLEKQRVTYTPPAEGDEALGGEEDPNADINAKIEELEQKLYESKREFRVSAVTGDEEDAMKEEIRKDLADELVEAAAKGRAGARTTAKLMGISSTSDINELVRVGANEETNRVIRTELRLRQIASATKVRYKDDWVQLTRDQVKVLHDKLGDAQIDMLVQAARAASSDVPEVTVPKS
ncbi:hypothetical protein ACFY5D_03705 [Paeniglutamicibacter sp. NPDC012692]|uniref:hypothetical protein n=1 Tax=Paeniglutamicibacter sp. NPDC012692 TaxID=3364388 RepID=UPI0036ACEE37